MTTEKIATTVHILDEDYLINCPVSEQAALISAARHLDKHMRDIRDSGKVLGVERIAVMAGLTIAHEMINSDTHNILLDPDTQDQINAMLKQLDGALQDTVD